MKKHLLRFSTLCLLAMIAIVGRAESITATWDFTNADIMEATMAFSGTTEAGEVEAIEKNGLKMIVEANGASFRNNGNSIQVATGATFKIPVKNAGDLITVNGYPDFSYYTIAGGEELKNDNTYKAKRSDAEAGYVAITSTNNNNYYKSISVTQYAEGPQLTEKSIYSTDFSDWEPAKATDPATNVDKQTKFTNETLSFSLFQTQVLSTDDTKFQNYITLPHMALRAEKGAGSTITTTPLANITKVRFLHGATGSNRGWKLEVKGDGDEDWVVVSDAVANPAGGCEVTKDINRTNCQLRFSNLADSQYAFLFELEIFGMVDLSGAPMLGSFKANGETYGAEIFEMGNDGNYTANIELFKSDEMISESNPITDVTADNGEIGTVTYAGDTDNCKVTIPVTASGQTVNYVANFIRKPFFTLSYMDLDGTTVLQTQSVEKDRAIGEFEYDINNVKATKDGYKARGWFKTGVLGEKFTTADVITADTKLYAIQTEIEEASTYKKYFFDLADKYFYAEDHEAFNPAGEGYYYHDAQHGWAFKNGNTVDLLVGPKATITVTLCQYGSGTGIVVKKGEETLATLDGKADGDGGTAVYSYEGEAGTLTLEMQCGGEMYIHAMKIVNTAEASYDSQGNWYFVKAGNASSLIDAIDVVNGKNAAKDAERAIIFLPDGIYDLDATVKTAITGHNISIVGQSMDKTIIVTKPDLSVEGLGKADLLDNSGTNLYLQDLTLQNALDYYAASSAGRAAVLQDAGNRTIGKNVRMLSYQDTYYSSNSSQQAYWENCDIHGTVDFICGGGDIRFQKSTISLEPRKTDGKGSRTVVAPTTKTAFGYVFDDCTVVDLAEGKGDWNFGRTWQNEPITVYLNTTLDDNAKNTLIATRWIEKGMNNTDPKTFGEYGTKDAAGTNITPASNIINSYSGAFETILTAEQAAAFAYDKMFTDWDPAALALQLDAPADAKYADGKVTFGVADNGMTGAAIFKNGEFAGISTYGSFDITIDPSQDKLTIRTANRMGGLGPEGKVATTTTGIADVRSKTEDVRGEIYDLQGRRIANGQKPTAKGLYIINGHKVVIK